MSSWSFNQQSVNCKKCDLYAFCETSDAASPFVTHRRQMMRKETLYSYKDKLTALYAIHSGAIKTYHIDMQGQERVVQFYLAGDLLGFEALHDAHYPFSAMSLSPSEVCEISIEQFMTHLASEPHLQKTILSKLSQRFNFGHYINAASAEQRIASFLLELSKRLDKDESLKEIELSMSRQDIGNYLRLAAETISRVLTRFQQMKLIVCRHKNIQIKDKCRLHYIAQDGLDKQLK